MAIKTDKFVLIGIVIATIGIVIAALILIVGSYQIASNFYPKPPPPLKTVTIILSIDDWNRFQESIPVPVYEDLVKRENWSFDHLTPDQQKDFKNTFPTNTFKGNSITSITND